MTIRLLHASMRALRELQIKLAGGPKPTDDVLDVAGREVVPLDGVERRRPVEPDEEIMHRSSRSAAPGWGMHEGRAETNERNA
jgi:hypothetical protein